MWKDLRGWLGFLLFFTFVIITTSGVTIRGKHYGVRDCNGTDGVIIDTGETIDAGTDAP